MEYIWIICGVYMQWSICGVYMEYMWGKVKQKWQKAKIDRLNKSFVTSLLPNPMTAENFIEIRI